MRTGTAKNVQYTVFRISYLLLDRVLSYSQCKQQMFLRHQHRYFMQ